MSSSVNKVIILGRLGQDPEVRQFNNGGQVTSLRVATSEQWKDKTTGERKESTEWHTVSVFGNDAEYVAKHGSKGRLVYVEGQLKTRKWQDKSGADRYSTEVVAQWPRGTVQFPAQDGERDQKPQNKAAARPQQSEDTGPDADFDDDIPF